MNKVMLIGNVGKDPEVHYYEADTAVAQVSLATTERGYTLQNGTKVPDRTDWHTVVFWKSLAKTVEKYVHKGDKLFVEGKVRYRSYDDKQGKRQYVTEIWADSLELLTPRSQSRKTINYHSNFVRRFWIHPFSIIRSQTYMYNIHRWVLFLRLF